MFILLEQTSQSCISSTLRHPKLSSITLRLLSRGMNQCMAVGRVRWWKLKIRKVIFHSSNCFSISRFLLVPLDSFRDPHIIIYNFVIIHIPRWLMIWISNLSLTRHALWFLNFRNCNFDKILINRIRVCRNVSWASIANVFELFDFR